MNLSMSSQAATTAAGNVSGSVNLYTGSGLTLGASMALSSYLDVEQDSHAEHGGLSALRPHGLPWMGI